MSNSLEESEQKNKQLVDEAFRVTRLYNLALNEVKELKNSKSPSQMGTNPFFSDRNEMLRKLEKTEAALKEKDETNKKLAQFLSDADYRAEEARKFLLATQNILKYQEQENLRLVQQLKEKEENEEVKQIILELKSRVHAKESELAIVSSEMVTTQRLLEEFGEKLEKLSEEREIFFEQDPNLKLLDLQRKSDSALQVKLAEKEDEIKKLQFENQRMASMISTLEGELKNDGLALKVRQLESQLGGYFKEQNAHQPPPSFVAPLPPQPSSNDYSFMSHMMDNMKQMQMEIQRMKSHQNQFNH